jgi:ComF family protein
MSLLLDLLFPRRCYGCGQIGTYFCPTCISGLPVHPPVYQSFSNFEGRLSLFKYHSFIKKSLLDLKYKFVTDVTDSIVNLTSVSINCYYPHLLNYWQQYHYCLVPIPLHQHRQNWRGFNQSELLASKLAKSLSLDCQIDILYRQTNTKPQAKLKLKSDRFINISSAFALNQTASLPQNIIIFDDVATTTATLNSALSVLPPSYYHRAWALTIA